MKRCIAEFEPLSVLQLKDTGRKTGHLEKFKVKRCHLLDILHPAALTWPSRLQGMLGGKDPIWAIMVRAGWCVDHSGTIKITHVSSKLPQLKCFFAHLKSLISCDEWKCVHFPLKQRAATAVTYKALLIAPKTSNNTDQAHMDGCIMRDMLCLCVPHTVPMFKWAKKMYIFPTNKA